MLGFEMSTAEVLKAKLLMDAAGNLYGTHHGGYAVLSPHGSVFKLTPSANGWIYTDSVRLQRHETTAHGPEDGLVMDATGNLYGTTSGGGTQVACTVTAAAWFSRSRRRTVVSAQVSAPLCKLPMIDSLSES